MGAAPQDVTVVSVSFNSRLVPPAMLASVPVGIPLVPVGNASADAGALAPLAWLAVRKRAGGRAFLKGVLSGRAG